MTESTDLHYTVDDVGGVQHAELTLRPGLNVLSGRNGTGKTSSMRAITRATGGVGELEPRDGAHHGSVSGPGVRLRVGKVTTRKGTDEAVAELALADVAPLQTLVEPGIKDAESANRAQIRALIDLLGVGLDDETIGILCRGDEEAAEWLRAEVAGEETSLDVAQGRLKRHLEGRARTHEGEAEAAEGVADAARRRAGDLLEAVGGEAALVDETPEAAREALIDASGRWERAKAQCEVREALEARQAEIRASIGERPDTTHAQAKLDAAQAAHEAAQERVADLWRKLTEARADLTASEAAVTQWSERLEEQSAAAQRWDEQQEVLAQDPEGPTRDDLERLRSESVEAAERHLDAAQRSAAYREVEAERADAERRREIAAQEGRRLRALAQSLPERLGEILASAGAHGFTVAGGRLCATWDGQHRDWQTRLSDGQRWRLALDVAASVYPRGDGGYPVVPIGTAIAHLDPVHRAEVHQMATERGLVLLAEEPSDGELRVEWGGEA